MTRTKNLNKKLGPATVIKEENGAKYVRTDDGKYGYFLVIGSLNGTPAAIGTKGTLYFRTTTSYGLPFFVENEGA